MYRIAIVEDSAFDRKHLTEFLRRYEKETGETFAIDFFSDGDELIKNYPSELDILFLDIMMERMDGLKTARIVRRMDDRVILFFVTSMVHYATQGYSVDALDFLVKPISYMGLKVRMDRARLRLQKKASFCLEIHNSEGIRSVSVNDICYLETCNHRVVVHTKTETIPANCSLRSLEQQLASMPFFRCHTSFLINLNYVDKIQGNDVWVNGEKLFVSRYRRKDFLDAWAAFLGD